MITIKPDDILLNNVVLSFRLIINIDDKLYDILSNSVYFDVSALTSDNISDNISYTQITRNILAHCNNL